MSNKRKNRKRYNKGSRQDYTKGGRVAKQTGGVQNQQFGSAQRIAEDKEQTDQVVTDNRTGDLDRGGYVPPRGSFNIPGLTPSPTPAPESTAREKRIEAIGPKMEQAAEGVVPESAVIKPAVQVGIDPETGKPLPKQQVTTMAAPTQVAATQAGQVAPEQVSQVTDVSQVSAPKPIEASQMEAATVDTDAQVDFATGAVSDEALAQAAGVDRVAPIDAAQIEIIPGALTERVVGTISPNALAPIVENVGSSLAKVTRAKKQLANAGLNEADIEELGNDPEALEARLMEFSESERGIIEGLPEEALVSNQLNSLLNGIEEGEVPTWARPAVASVEAMLAQRGMSASTVGRDALLNAIITSALPIAQSNAQAIQQSVGQQKSIEATAALKDAEMAQQTALFNAQNVFSMDMAQFSADQQRAINNSKFLQTASIQNATMEQQGVLQDAVLMSQRNLAEADQNTKFAIQNAQAFLSMDLQNLNNQQQANVLKAQQIQQRLLSNQAASNAALQFNATSENQVNQFMTSIKAQTDQFNAQQNNAMKQFNTTQINAAEARRVANEFEAAKLDAQMATQIDQFNAEAEARREQFNVTNATAIAQSNVAWRRNANTADTAAINAVNQQNAQNAFGLSTAAQNFLWQELRDEADYTFKRWDNDQQRKASLMIAALGNESGTATSSSWSSNIDAITKLVGGWLD